MYFHSFYYSFKTLLRNRPQMFWCFAFPILLATMFHFAFSGLSSDESFSAIPVAVVTEGNTSDMLRDLFDTLGNPGDDQFLAITYTTEEEALSLLEQKDIIGILYAGEQLRLSVSDQMVNLQLEQSILSAFVEQFNMEYQAIQTIYTTHPERFANAIATLSSDTSYLSDTSISGGSTDEALTYFFNLIAMTCLYAAMAGSNIAIDNQANLSELGMRRNVSPVHRMISILGGISATVLFQFLSVVIGVCYMDFILGVDFGDQISYVLLACLVGCITGVSLGFMIGCFGNASRMTKFGILMAVVMLDCMASGLMIGNMRVLVENFCPLINKINPAALISDSFYALVIYPSHERYFTNIALLLLLSICFGFIGFILVRRKKYASLSDFL